MDLYALFTNKVGPPLAKLFDAAGKAVTFASPTDEVSKTRQRILSGILALTPAKAPEVPFRALSGYQRLDMCFFLRWRYLDVVIESETPAPTNRTTTSWKYEVVFLVGVGYSPTTVIESAGVVYHTADLRSHDTHQIDALVRSGSAFDTPPIPGTFTVSLEGTLDVDAVRTHRYRVQVQRTIP